MGNAMVVVCAEWCDGSMRTIEVEEHVADAQAYEWCLSFPSARVWVGDRMLQQGFLAADDLFDRDYSFL